jgi:hypothetical protein
MSEPVGFADASNLPLWRRGSAFRLSLRLDSVRRLADAARRRAGSAQHRLRQYRRHERLAQRPARPGGSDADRRHAQGHHCGSCHPPTAWPRLCAGGGGGRVPRPSVSSVAAFSRRQGRRDLYRGSPRHRLAGSHRVLRHLARSRRADPLLVVGGFDCQRGGAVFPMVARQQD